MSLISAHGDAVLDALSVCTRKPRTWIDTLALDDAIRLFEAVFEVNADFFVTRVAPAIARVSGVIQTKVAGQTPSPGSFAPVTGSPTS